MTVRWMPDGYHTVTPWIIGRDTAGLMEFLAAAFDAEDLGGRVVDEHGKIGHAEMRIGDSVVTEPTHLFWGDIVARVHDPYGNLYWLQTRIEEVTPDEMTRRLTDEKFLKAMEYVQNAIFRPEA